MIEFSIFLFGCLCFWGGYFLSLKSNEGIGFINKKEKALKRLEAKFNTPKIEDPEDPTTWDMPPLDRDNPKWIKFGRKVAENNMKKEGRKPSNKKPTHKIKSHYHGNSFHIGEEVFIVEKWKEPSRHKCCKNTYVMENKEGMRFNVGTCEIEKL